MMKLLRHVGAIGWIGIISTIAYAAAMSWFVDGRWSDLQDLKLNELGDFLAGAFGPLAILWLVLGFFQQGIELRQNSAALKLQADELKNSVIHQAELVAVSKEQLNTEREIFAAHQTETAYEKTLQEKRMMARFTISYGGYMQERENKSRHLIQITNTGYKCTEFKAILRSDVSEIQTLFLHSIENMESIDFRFISPSNKTGNGELAITYTDGLGVSRATEFRLNISGNGVQAINQKVN